MVKGKASPMLLAQQAGKRKMSARHQRRAEEAERRKTEKGTKK